MDTKRLSSFIGNYWDEAILPSLAKFITIPCVTPSLNSNWKTDGHFDEAIQLISDWINAQKLGEVKIDVLRLKDIPPCLIVDIPGDSDRTVMFYGHLDKMPGGGGWAEGLGPWHPVLKDNYLYGRGVCDDGYAAFVPIAIIKALREQKISHARCVLIFETEEESGSMNFPLILNELHHRIGNPDLVFVLDAGGDSDQELWCCNSLRGIIVGKLTVENLKSGAHSGLAGGVVPSSFRIIRQLLSRIEDENTGEFLLPEFSTDVPKDFLKQIKAAAHVIGKEVYTVMPLLNGAKPVTEDVNELLLNQLWRPALSVVGAGGLPPIHEAGNVLLPKTELQLSIRIPPMVDSAIAGQKLKQVLEQDPPYGAKVEFSIDRHGIGWAAPAFEHWILEDLKTASNTYFGKPTIFKGLGGAIGVVNILGQLYPQAQFIVTGAEVPSTNAHGPNESLDIDFAKKMTCCLCELMAKHLEARK